MDVSLPQVLSEFPKQLVGQRFAGVVLLENNSTELAVHGAG
jgi:hypothetical protein